MFCCGETDRPPCDPLHDEVLAGLQMFDDVFAQRRFSLDEALDHFVEVKGGEVEDVQNPGEAQVRSSLVTSSVLETTLWSQK